MTLIDLKEHLRHLPRAGQRSHCLDIAGLAAGYHQLHARAPRRSQGYLSQSRSGVTSSGESSNRAEEHLAVALANKRELSALDGSRLTLLDYQFPLKSVRSDAGIGKIDLLGLCDDGTLAVMELKVNGNREDRRIALLEGLIYAAIVEANIAQIAGEVLALHGLAVAQARPKVLLVAPPAYWSDTTSFPSTDTLLRLAAEAARAVPIDITLLQLNGAGLYEFGLNGQRPLLRGDPFLSTVGGNAGVGLPRQPR